MNLGVQGGLVLLFGNDYDKDKDGLMDNNDSCLATPVGEQVDTARVLGEPARHRP